MSAGVAPGLHLYVYTYVYWCQIVCKQLCCFTRSSAGDAVLHIGQRTYKQNSLHHDSDQPSTLVTFPQMQSIRRCQGLTCVSRRFPLHLPFLLQHVRLQIASARQRMKCIEYQILSMLTIPLWCRWQVLSRSLERVTAVHGDEGDDQHGLKVHEVHDMQPGAPSKQVAVNTASGAVGTLPLVVSPPLAVPGDALGGESQPPAIAKQLVSAQGALHEELSGQALGPQLPVGAPKQVLGEDAAAEPPCAAKSACSGDYATAHAAPSTVQAIIDLCSPDCPKLRPETVSAPADAAHNLRVLELSLDMAEQDSLSQAGKLDLEMLHDLRPAGIILDEPSGHQAYSQPMQTPSLSPKLALHTDS